ncbi:18047_t:CDS:2 [Racocetra fulgida]|uniref:18046_t:CDS:1 n=1 Tax=Racocetra fulgida TaxID=60492 RepID=A0A9N8VJ49_9GLOM|nr:18046_t:CDS:2 [Racocetra fulgida]CAG8457398.1 18047_t:CDS:2 [Racocetra fulgida]
MSFSITQLTIIDLDEDNSYFDLCNDIFLAPTLILTSLSENQHQSTSNLTSFPPWQPSYSLISLSHRF